MCFVQLFLRASIHSRAPIRADDARGYDIEELNVFAGEPVADDVDVNVRPN